MPSSHHSADPPGSDASNLRRKIEDWDDSGSLNSAALRPKRKGPVRKAHFDLIPVPSNISEGDDDDDDFKILPTSTQMATTGTGSSVYSDMWSDTSGYYSTASGARSSSGYSRSRGYSDGTRSEVSRSDMESSSSRSTEPGRTEKRGSSSRRGASPGSSVHRSEARHLDGRSAPSYHGSGVSGEPYFEPKLGPKYEAKYESKYGKKYGKKYLEDGSLFSPGSTTSGSQASGRTSFSGGRKLRSVSEPSAPKAVAGSDGGRPHGSGGGSKHGSHKEAAHKEAAAPKAPEAAPGPGSEKKAGKPASPKAPPSEPGSHGSKLGGESKAKSHGSNSEAGSHRGSHPKAESHHGSHSGPRSRHGSHGSHGFILIRTSKPGSAKAPSVASVEEKMSGGKGPKKDTHAKNDPEPAAPAADKAPAPGPVPGTGPGGKQGKEEKKGKGAAPAPAVEKVAMEKEKPAAEPGKAPSQAGSGHSKKSGKSGKLRKEPPSPPLSEKAASVATSRMSWGSRGSGSSRGSGKAPSEASSRGSTKAPSEKAPSETSSVGSSGKAPSSKAPSEKAPSEKAPSEKAHSDKAPSEKAPSEKPPSEKPPANPPSPPKEDKKEDKKDASSSEEETHPLVESLKLKNILLRAKKRLTGEDEERRYLTRRRGPDGQHVYGVDYVVDGKREEIRNVPRWWAYLHT